MKKTLTVTKMTNAIIIWGEVHIFHYTNKQTNCTKCSLKGYCAEYDGVFGHVCDQFKDFWKQQYKYGYFKKERKE